MRVWMNMKGFVQSRKFFKNIFYCQEDAYGSDHDDIDDDDDDDEVEPYFDIHDDDDNDDDGEGEVHGGSDVKPL